MTFLDHIVSCNNADLSDFIPWTITRQLIGYVNRNTASWLLSFCEVFSQEDGSIKLSDQLTTPKQRTEAVAKVLEVLRNEKRIGANLNENYAVTAGVGTPILMTIDRSAATLLGIISSGFHLNGFLADRGGLMMWVAKRSKDRGAFPGKLDNMVAGGQPSNLTISENVIKECEEEASIPRELAVSAKPTGLISYLMQINGNLLRHVMYTYDLELKPNFFPKPNDGEVEKFSLVNIQDVMATLQTSPSSFKFNCNLIIIDFLVRHGLIKPNDPDYFEIVKGLRSPLN